MVLPCDFTAVCHDSKTNKKISFLFTCISFQEMRSGGFLIKIGDLEIPRNPATHQIGRMFGTLFPLLK
jgi:hypothetical protein